MPEVSTRTPSAPRLYQPISSITVRRTDLPEPLPTIEGAARQAQAERYALKTDATTSCTYHTAYENGRRTVALVIEGENPALAAVAMDLEDAGCEYTTCYSTLRMPLTRMEITHVPESEPANLSQARRALAACDSGGGYTGPIVETHYPGRFWIMLGPRQWIEEIVDAADGCEYHVRTFRRAIKAIAANHQRL